MRNFPCVEQTIEIRVRPNLLLRLWIDRSPGREDVRAIVGSEIFANILEAQNEEDQIEALAQVPGINAFQIIYGHTTDFCRFGTMVYTVPFSP